MGDQALNPSAVNPLRSERLAATLGIALGVSFTVCFATGLLSHLAQDPDPIIGWPTRPAGLYRVTQGCHVLTGFVSIPLLLAKLWVVFPNLFEWPPVRSIGHAVERLALLPLVGGGLFLLLSGTANVARWYPWSFFFPSAHYSVAWLTVGALAIHIGSKWTTIRGGPTEGGAEAATQRRSFLSAVGATAGLMFIATAGNTISPLSRLSVLAQRRPGVGPQGVPVNKSAEAAGVIDAATDPGYRLRVRGDGIDSTFSLAELRAMPLRTAVLPIACVEGWSTSATWRGVPLRELLNVAGVDASADVEVVSLQRRGLYGRSRVTSTQADDLDTLLALELNGDPLHLDHGAPVRLIGPNRPGVTQTKWVSTLEIV